MKAYKAWDAMSLEDCATVVFAETAQAAKKVAFATEVCEDADYISVRVQRFPQMDEHYRGRSEIDWDDLEDRKALVALGWMCSDISWECDTCPVKNICGQWEGEDEEA